MKRERTEGETKELVDDDGFTFRRKVKTRSGGLSGKNGAQGSVNTRAKAAGAASVGRAKAVPPPKPSAELLYQKTSTLPDLHKSIPTTW